MPSIKVLLAATLAAAAFAQDPKPAPKRKPQPQVREIRATGCVRKARNGCLLLRTLDGNTTYTFRAAPAPDDGIVITVTAVPHDGPGSCNQGVAIDVTDWVPTGEQCID